MPPWVARQWHACGCSPSVFGDLRRVQRFAGPIKLRFYAQSSIQNGASRRPRKVNSAVIVPSSIANTRPEDLIAHIKPVLRQRVTNDRFAVFFVTPSFATWLLDDQVFLHKALRRAYAHILDRNDTPYARIHALCAVVHKLPVSRPIGNVDNMEEENLQRIQDPAVQEIGREGIAYATLRFSDSLPASSGAGEDKAAISFVALEGSDENSGHFSDSVRLPLANTVFQTGSPTTMTYSTWEKARGSQELTLKEKRNISHHGIRMQLENDSQPTVLSVPLVPLSKPREVEASMGNILRRVKGPDGASITASQELEQHVPRFFSARGEPSQATTVWALVMDRDQMLEAQERTESSLQQSQASESSGVLQNQSEDKMWENLWKQDPPVWSPLVPVALRSGARLHRVLSGGGGWGKKAGLLSLDPIPSMEAESADDPFDEINGPDLDSALQQVAREGDYVQFFVSPSVPAQDDVIAGSEDKAVWGLELGTIPSTTDAMPVIPSQSETSGTNEISVFRNIFGALAEGGMVISRSFKLNPAYSFSTIGKSTVDVPFSRYSMVDWRAESSPDEDVDSFRDCHESKPFCYHRDLAKTLYSETMPRFLGLGHLVAEIPRKTGKAQAHTLREDSTELLSAQQRLPPRATPKVQRTRTLTPHLAPKLQYTAGIPTETRSVPNDISHDALSLNPEQKSEDMIPAQPLIRFYKMDTPQRDELAYCIDSLRRVDRKVARCVKEYRELMQQIRRQNGLRMDLALRQLPPPPKKPLPPTFIPLMRRMVSDSYEEVEDLVYQYQEAITAVRAQREDVPVLIRKTVTGIPRGFVSWLEDATEQSAYWVGMYQRDFEQAMARIRMDRIYRTDLSTTVLAPVGRPRSGTSSTTTVINRLTNVRLTPRRLLAGLSETVRQTQIIIDGLQDQTHFILQMAVVDLRATELSETIAALQKILSNMLTVMSFRAHMALDANNSAVDVYTLHLHLRWALTSMIMATRGRRSAQKKLARLRDTLTQLRAFDENLFIGRKNLTRSIVHGKLMASEMKRHLSRKMMIREGKYVPRDRRQVGFVAGGKKEVETVEKEGKTKVRRMVKQYEAVKQLEDIVKGWLT